jgi:hypothetical protein
MAADVVDEIMRILEAIRLGGERRKNLGPLSDVAGFTSISERLT